MVLITADLGGYVVVGSGESVSGPLPARMRCRFGTPAGQRKRAARRRLEFNREASKGNPWNELPVA